MPAKTIWSDLQKLRETALLVHNIANFVVMNKSFRRRHRSGVEHFALSAGKEVPSHLQ
jgi:hypothetical protein